MSKKIVLSSSAMTIIYTVLTQNDRKIKFALSVIPDVEKAECMSRLTWKMTF